MPQVIKITTPQNEKLEKNIQAFVQTVPSTKDASNCMALAMSAKANKKNTITAK